MRRRLAYLLAVLSVSGLLALLFGVGMPERVDAPPTNHDGVSSSSTSIPARASPVEDSQVPRTAPDESEATGTDSPDVAERTLVVRLQPANRPGREIVDRLTHVADVEAYPREVADRDDPGTSIDLRQDETHPGLFSFVWKSGSKPSLDVALFRDASAISVYIWLFVGMQGSRATNWRTVTPKVVGTTIDLGTIEYDIAENPEYFDSYNDWIVAGRLVDSLGNPLHSIGHAGRISSGGDLEIGFTAGVVASTEPGVAIESFYQGIWTDEQGYFADPIPVEAVGPKARPDPATMRQLFDPTRQSWTLGYSAREGLLPAGRFELPPPKVDLTLALIDFGEIVVPGPVLELQMYVPKDLQPEEEIHEFGELYVSSGDLRIHLWSAEIGRVYRFALPAGTYRVLGEINAKGWKPLDHLIDSTKWNVRPEPNPTLALVEDNVVLQGNDVRQLRLEYQPAPLVEVSVEMPSDAAEGVLEVRYSNGETPLRPIGDKPFKVRLLPGNPIARALFPGYEPVQAVLSADQPEVVLRPSKKDTSSKITVQFPDEHPNWVYLRFQGEVDELTTILIRERSAGPVRLPPGKYALHVLVDPGSAPPEGVIAGPIEFELMDAEERVLTVTKLLPLNRRGSVVMCGSHSLNGTLPGEQVGAPGQLALARTNSELLCVIDGEKRHEWSRDHTNSDGNYELRLPPRIEVRISEQLREVLGGELPEYSFVVVSFDTPCGRASIETDYRSKQSLVRQFWAPPGQAQVRVRAIDNNPSVYLQYTVEVMDGKVAVVEIGKDLGTARFSPHEAIGARRSSTGIQPIWELHGTGNLVDWVHNSRQLLPAGSYFARPAFGPETNREVHFEISPGRETPVALPAIAIVPTRGRALINLPNGATGRVHFDVSVSPSPWPGYLREWSGEKETASARLVPEGVLIEGLTNNVPLIVTVVAHFEGDAPARCQFTVILPDEEIQQVDAIWRSD